jgi:3-oxoacyl-[acyl-carrier protein] reductase
LNQLYFPLMKPGSSVIYIGSTLSEKAVGKTASYVTTKHAVAGLMKATCQDLIHTGIHTCCICPGFTHTEMLQARIDHDPAILAFATSKQVLGRLVEPQEIADVVWFCALHPVMNGAMVHANLGQVEN